MARDEKVQRVRIGTQMADTNRAMLEAAVDGSGTMIVVQDRSGRVLSSNTTARSILGISSDTVDIGAAFAALDPIHEDGDSFSSADLPAQVALRRGVDQRNIRLGLLLDGGDRRWLRTSAHVVDLDGRDVVVTSLTDVTDDHPTEEILRDSDDRFRVVAEQAPIAIFIVGLDGELLYGNPAAEEATGRSMQDLRAIGWLACIHPDDQTRLAEGPSDFNSFEPVEYRIIRPDGSIRWLRATGTALHDREGVTVGLVGTAEDVTELRRATDRVRDSEARARAILETAAEGIVSSDDRGVIIEFNAAAERIFGFDSDELIDRGSVFDLFAIADRARFRSYFADYLDGGEPRLVGRGRVELVGCRRDGSDVAIEVALSDIETHSGRLFTTVIRDLSAQKAFERELQHLETHDVLTGLPNRALFAAQLDAALVRASTDQRPVAVLFIDIDRIRLVTEALGHRAGDELIVQVAQRMLEAAGSDATVARFSNDQFVAFLDHLGDVGDAVDAAVRIIESVNEPFLVGPDDAFLDTSIGLDVATDGTLDAEALVNNAHVAMGRAKDSSVTRYEVFDREMRSWVEITRATELALRYGIERDEFELHYQPVIDLSTAEVCGYEALVRWNHPELGLRMPDEFIPIAEESGLIVPLGEQLLRLAIEQSARWRSQGPGSQVSHVSINLSARQLESPGLAMAVEQALEEFGTNPSDVTFEITETVLFREASSNVRTLDELKSLGVRLSLDDFGTGYSSLIHLCELPIDAVKIDRIFVSQLGTHSRDASIVELVVGMARTLHLDVVAEGVETEDQAAALRALGCRYGQGYLFARPAPVDELIT